MAEKNQSNVIIANNLKIDLDRYEAVINGRELKLARKEYELLVFLARNAGYVFNREKIMAAVWGVAVPLKTRTVDVHIRRLRSKMRSAGKYIRALRGVGYKFKP
ncbi:MAG: response regulator transcription factor [bacterium]